MHTTVRAAIQLCVIEFNNYYYCVQTVCVYKPQTFSSQIQNMFLQWADYPVIFRYTTTGSQMSRGLSINLSARLFSFYFAGFLFLHLYHELLIMYLKLLAFLCCYNSQAYPQFVFILSSVRELSHLIYFCLCLSTMACFL